MGVTVLKKSDIKKTTIFVIICLFVSTNVLPNIDGINELENPSSLNSSSIDEWPMFHHDPSLCGFSLSNAPETNHVKWSFETSDKIGRGITVANNKAYVGSHDNKVYCLDATTGVELWNYETGDKVLSSPAVSDNKVYVSSKDGKVYCLDENTGTLIWEYSTGWTIWASPIVVDSRVFIGSWDDKMYCLNAETGEKIWSYKAGWSIGYSAAVVNDKVYFGSNDFKVYCLDATDGSKIWSHNGGSYIFSSPALYSNRVYIVIDDYLKCLDAATGEVIWSFTKNDPIDATPAIANGKVYIPVLWPNENLYCLDADNGSIIWNYDIGKSSHSSPAIAEGKIYFGACNDKVYCLDANSGSEIWTYKTGDEVTSSPAIAYDRVYICSKDHKLYCFEDYTNQPPLADFTWTPSNPIEGQSITFDASSSYDPDGSIVSYVWDFDDDGQFDDGSGIIETYTYQNTGDYQITVKVTDNEGLTDTQCYIVYVSGSDNEPPYADFTWTPSQPNEGETVNFDASSSYDPDGSIVSYVWDFDDDGSFDDGSGVNPIYSWSNAGNYPVSLKIIDDDGAVDTETKTVSVGNVVQPPVADFDFYPDPGTEDEPVNFNAYDSYDPDGSIISYSWSFGDGHSGSGISTSHTYTNTGYFDVTLTVTDNDGLSDSETKTISIISGENIPPTVEITSPDDGDEVSETITITGTASDQDGSISYVQVRVDNEPWQTVSGTFYWTMSWDTTVYSEGNHAISAQSFDGEDYSSVDTIVVNVQNGGDEECAEPPQLSTSDEWEYKIPNLYIKLGNFGSLDTSIANLDVDVVSASSEYNIKFKGDLPTGTGSKITISIPGTNIDLPNRYLYKDGNTNPYVEGNIHLTKNDLSLKEVTLKLKGRYGRSSSQILKPKIDIDVTIEPWYSGEVYDFFDFGDKICVDETWEVDEIKARCTISLNIPIFDPITGSFPVWFKEHSSTCLGIDTIDENQLYITDAFHVKSLDNEDQVEYWYSPDEKAVIKTIVDLALDAYIDDYLNDWLIIQTNGILKGCPPEKPEKPSGEVKPKAGEECAYSTKTTDPNDDLIRYGWDWNGDKLVDEWTSFYESGKICTISHVWTTQELNGKSIRVKARDINGEESPWSESLDLNTDRLRIKDNILFVFIMKVISRFPMLSKIFFSSFYY
jgi:outer membrane protein assembly factor BamB